MFVDQEKEKTDRKGFADERQKSFTDKSFQQENEERGLSNSLKRTSCTWSGVKGGGGDAGRPSESIHSNTLPRAIGADGHQVRSLESAEAFESLIRVEEDRCMDPDAGTAPLETDAEPGMPLELLSLKIFFENFFFFDASKPNIILRPDSKLFVRLLNRKKVQRISS